MRWKWKWFALRRVIDYRQPRSTEEFIWTRVLDRALFFKTSSLFALSVLERPHCAQVQCRCHFQMTYRSIVGAGSPRGPELR